MHTGQKRGWDVGRRDLPSQLADQVLDDRTVTVTHKADSGLSQAPSSPQARNPVEIGHSE